MTFGIRTLLSYFSPRLIVYWIIFNTSILSKLFNHFCIVPFQLTPLFHLKTEPGYNDALEFANRLSYSCRHYKGFC